MKAVLIDEKKELYIGEVPYPELKSDTVIIKIEYAALNRADLLQRAGSYPPPPGSPEWMGLEVSGGVVELGSEAAEKSGLAIGDKVCALLGGGGYAEYVGVEYVMVIKIPKGFTMAEAACIPEVYCTAYLNLFYEGAMKPGETVLVHAGASGVGIAVTQLAKLFGGRVIATVRGDEKAEAIRKFGADLIVNSKTTDVESIFDENPVDLVIDCVGGDIMGKCFSKMNRYGRWIMIATLGGDLTEIDLKETYKRGLRLIGSTLRSRTPETKAAILSHLVEDVYRYFESGDLHPEIFAVYPFEQADAAQEAMKLNKNIGKILLKMG